MLGYLRDKKVGAMTYNPIHNYILALIIVILGLWQGSNFVASLGVIFCIAHRIR